MNKTTRNMLGTLTALSALTLGAAQTARAQATLTLGTEFSTDAFGNSSSEAYSTGSGGYNLYLKKGGSFLNANDGSISIPLSVGANTFALFGDAPSSPDLPNYGLNLFFGGANNSPVISVFGAEGTLGNPTPAFAPNSAPSTYAASAVVPGSGTLSARVNGYDVTLTNYYWQSPTVQSTDQVGTFTTGASGVNDFTGSITLQVTATPEPGSIALFLAALTTGGILLRRRRK